MLYLASSLTLENEYKALANLPDKGYKQSLRSALVYSSDPGQAAYYGVQDEKHAFLKKLGKQGSFGGKMTPKSNALYNLKLAIRYQDKDAFEKYLVEYATLGGTAKGLNTSLKNMDPLFGMNKEEQVYFVTQWLDNEGRERLKLADQYYKSVILGQRTESGKEAAGK